MEDINLMTNDELKERKKLLLNEFENQKTIIANAYNIMLSAQEQYSKIEEILNKRQGNS